MMIVKYNYVLTFPSSSSYHHPHALSGGKQIQMNESRKGVKAVYYQLSLFPPCRSHTLSQCQENEAKIIRRFADREAVIRNRVRKAEQQKFISTNILI